MSLYRRDERQSRDQRKPVSCRFCGTENLTWGEVAPDKFRLHEPDGSIHDCRQFHDAKRNGGVQRPANPAVVERGSLLKRMNTWTQRWAKTLSADALEELDEILDDASRR